MKIISLTLALIFTGTIFTLNAQEEARLLRFPAIHGGQVVFTYAGDLYKVKDNGGTARRLTTHNGYESFPKFSPDGSMIAFTGQYDGNTEVYVIPAEGGNPKRITYTPSLGRDDIADRMGPNNIVIGWQGNDQVLFRSRMKSFNAFKGQLYLAPLDGSMHKEIPLITAGFASFAPDGTKMAFNKVFREFRTWKYYRGGMADDIRIFNMETKEIDRITSHEGQDIIPMWVDNKIYFISDRDRTMNLFSYDLSTGQEEKITNFEMYDVKFPSAGEDAIVFENGGFIYKYDIATGQTIKVDIFIADDNLVRNNKMIDASAFINSSGIAPDGRRAVFTARGDIFTLPVKEGVVRNLTSTSGVHERNAKWSPDGKYIAYISDESGEDEIYIIPQKGIDAPIQLTDGADTYKYNLSWSPDGKKILWSDKKLRLQYVDIATRKVTLVDQAESWEIRNFEWSPDSRWVTYVRPMPAAHAQIYIYSVENDAFFSITNGWYNSSHPTFSEDGKYLFFISAREFNPIYSWTEWNHAYVDMAGIYFITLADTTQSPFQLKSDEVKISGADDRSKEKKGKKEKKGTASDQKMDVDIDGIQYRIAGLPLDPANYRGLSVAGGKVYYLKRKHGDRENTFWAYDLKKEKETFLGSISGYEISANNKKMMVRKGKNFSIIDLPEGDIKLEEKLQTGGMQVMVDPQAEWNQIFYEAWRQMRDFFYDPNMHGVDWVAVRQKYEVLLPYISHRDDLSYIIGEMIGELNVGHAYVGGGDRPAVEKIHIGMLGAELIRDDNSGYYQIVDILEGENWIEDLRSPLTEIGVNVQEGEYIIAINGQPTHNMDNIHKAMIGMADKLVELTVNSSADPSGAREVLVKPRKDEDELYYFTWVQNNIDKVSEATDGQVGYIHIPDMGVAGLNQFVKHYYPQLNKKALIIDVRGNGGGNVSSMIIERLQRELAMVNKARNTIPSTNPGGMVLGPKVTLMDQWSASDGDLFPYRFKHHQLGPLIGHRSWGGVVGIRGSLPFIDGGYLMKPEFAPYDTAGEKWIIEGYGVDPDIEIDNNPYKEYMGEDEQLNMGIEVIMELLEEEGQELPDVPDYPVKTK